MYIDNGPFKNVQKDLINCTHTENGIYKTLLKWIKFTFTICKL